MLLERVLPWALRGAWIAVLVAGMPAIGGAYEGRPEAVEAIVQSVAGVLWLAGVAAMAIPAVVSLTATRLIVPVAVPAAVAAWIAGGAALDAVAWLTAAVIATLVAFTPELGHSFVQASAYGDEDRHLLRAPLAYLLACVVLWTIAAAGVIAGPLLLADRRWIIGGVISAATVAVVTWGRPRWHKLTRRWVVFVPAGVVLHDHLVLAETVMVRGVDLASLHLALSGTEAADLTGPAQGHAVELVLREPATVILAATPKTPRGTAIHMRAGLVCPTRPGRLLADAARRHLPVG